MSRFITHSTLYVLSHIIMSYDLSYILMFYHIFYAPRFVIHSMPYVLS